ncbi:hypothetical protein LOAG_13483 [Loa loa]|uniref:Uncharacterized protein n=1 Tax=Loa loa TaxID=7209 RepID=A0A1S0TJG4_LOALO|nr:hypothetical protein LOAG_13483 [Loa loa]EFO15031.1 hypothetical protein LOAG_13483 [Loa loa]
MNICTDLTKSSNWQEWSNWTKCKNNERIRFRSCISTKFIDNTITNDNNSIDNGTIDKTSLSMHCEIKKIESERQFCLISNMNKDKDQKLINPNPFMIETEIIGTYLKRPKINHEPVKVIEIQYT